MTEETCGCRFEGHIWTKMCSPHRTEAMSIHERAQRERSVAVNVHTIRRNGALILLNGKEPNVEQVKSDRKIVVKQSPAAVQLVDSSGTRLIRAKPAREGTKLEKAIDIYKGLQDKSRKNTIKVFMKEIGLSEAAASTYHNIAKKRTGL